MRVHGWTAAAILTTACYSGQQIAPASLDGLTTVPGRRWEKQVPGQGCTGCAVTVDPTTPILLTTAGGATHRLTPFQFQIVDEQIVAPEQGVLVDRSEVLGAEVRTFSALGTTLLIVGVAALAAGSFAAIQLTAGSGSLER